MPYIGIGPNFGNLSTQAGIGDGADVTPIATLDYTVATSASIGVYLDGVRQVAGTDYVANGTTLTFTTAPPNLVKIEVVFFGLSVDIGTPGDNTVTNAKMADNAIDSDQYVDGSIDNVHLADDAVNSDELAAGAVDLAHMSADSVDSSQLIAGSVDLTHLSATGTASSSNFLRGDNSWTAVDALPTQTSHSGKYLTTNGSAASWDTLDTDANTTTKGLYEHSNVISVNYVIGNNNNALTAGPITINSSISVTIPSGSTWVIA